MVDFYVLAGGSFVSGPFIDSETISEPNGRA